MPVVLFDGDCSFCRLWVGYWSEQTGERVEYAPWQTSLKRFPGVNEQECRRAVQWIGPERRASGAEAVLLILAILRRYAWLLWLYRKSPAFASFMEWGYALVAAHRTAGYRVTRFLWGNSVRVSSYDRPVLWFRRGLAAIYIFAFASFGMQARGLIGERGILPLGMYLGVAKAQLGAAAPWRIPTLFWWGHSDYVILYVAWGGVGVAFLALVARNRSRWYPALFALLFVYYLSLVSGGQIFMGYQWDFLLLEAGFLAIFLRPAKSRVWLLHWLLFRLMFESALAKLVSHDATWHDFTALTFHYETQPLPTPVAWFIHQAPVWFQKLSAKAMFAVELVVPFLFFAPRRMKQWAAFATLTLQLLIALTGNYTFFNLLAMVLCIPLFDDAALGGQKPASAGKPARLWLNVALATLVLSISVPQLGGMLGYDLAGAAEMMEPLSPFGIVNQYGLFASMTTTRPEIQVEGSMDGEKWEAYVFRYKPGPLGRAPGWVAPFQPRLDWQMWFAALRTFKENPWFARFMVALLQGSPPVNDLFEKVPFGGIRPKFVRATVDLYRFTTPAERARTGNWWKREPRGVYFPAASLRAQ